MIKQIETVLDLIKAGYQPIDASHTKQYAAIGRLLVCVSNDIDARITACLRSQISGDEEAVTRVVIGAIRVGDAISALTQIGAVRELDAAAKTQMATLFDEIGELRKVRDIVAHRTCLVKGDGFAFHNALSARTDEKIQVHYFTIDELAEFSAYAERLGYRVAALSCILIPVPMHPNKKIALEMTVFGALQKFFMLLIEAKLATRDKHEYLWTLHEVASNAIHAHVKKLPDVDEQYVELQQAATKGMIEFAHALTMIDKPSSRDIPARLQKQDRKIRRGGSR